MELKECTFKPKMIADNSKYNNDLEFIKRNELWN
jgi:hypothetical protein